MPQSPDLPRDVRDLLALGRRDRRAARDALDVLPLDEQVALVCRAPVSRRAELLELAAHPERLVPALPEAELVFTVKAIGRADAAWLLAHATDEQLRACIDLDAWRRAAPDRDVLGEWIETFAEADDDTLVRAAQALDPELLHLWLADRAEVTLKTEDPGWQPPSSAATIDGQFYLVARGSGDELDVVMRLLALLFESDYWFYFRLLQSVIWELPAENEEWALRWRAGRLQDLGFPPREEALAIYAAPRPDELDRLPDTAPVIGTWHLPVFLPELPTAPDATLSLFRAAADLDEDGRRVFLYAFLALANRVAVADDLPLGDAGSIPKAIEKAARAASRGLDWMAERHGVEPAAVLRRTSLVHLFRVGTHLRDGDTGDATGVEKGRGGS
jgi:hypothetical protein